MDGYQEFPSDFEPSPAVEAPAQSDVAAAIGTDERRMHVRAYNYWVSLLEGRDFPSIEDLEPADVTGFAAHSVLLDYTCGPDNPAIPYIGTAIRDECGIGDDVRTIADVPGRSLLSRLTDHNMQIIANRAPIGFEAEFANPRGESICYRGILMPFSSDGDTIDFIYGVINWKTVGSAADGVEELLEMADAVAAEPEPAIIPETAEAQPLLPPEPELTEATVPEPVVVTDDPVSDDELLSEPIVSRQDPLSDDDELTPEILLGDDAGLADRLWAARETAESVKAGEGRTRAALYHALSLAYDFAIAARESPEDYAELLEESGVKAQARAPMTPIVKLVFGVDYDKARLTEFAAALSFGDRNQIGLGNFEDFIGKQAGGLKALVAAERNERRPEARPDTQGDAARAALRLAVPLSLDQIPADAEFAVIVTRRGADGRHQPVALVDDQALIERVIRKAA
jgi:hypothetical protein